MSSKNRGSSQYKRVDENFKCKDIHIWSILHIKNLMLLNYKAIVFWFQNPLSVGYLWRITVIALHLYVVEDKDKAQNKYQDKAKVSTFFVNSVVLRLQLAALIEECEDESDFSVAK